MNMLLESSRMGITAECYQHPAVTNHIAVGGHMTSAHNTTPLVQSVTVFPTSKVCTQCRTDKPMAAFSKEKMGKHGKQSKCRECRYANNRAYIAKNRNKIVADAKAYYQANKAKCNRRTKAHKLANREHHLHQAIWYAMNQRCANPDNAGYPRYGGRGISVCDRWIESYDNFISDMGYRPSDDLQLDRRDNDGNYEPSNCRWVTPSENLLNRSPARSPSCNSKTGIAGVYILQSGGYMADIKNQGKKHQIYTDDFFEACCWRKSREINFRGNTA